MAVIEKRELANGKTVYRVKIRLKNYPSLSATFATKDKAKYWAQKTEVEIKEGKYFKTVEAKKHTLAEAIDRYLTNFPQNKKKSLKKQSAQLLIWKELIGHHLLADVTPALVVEQRDKLFNGITVRGTKRSSGTVNRYLAILSHLFSIAVCEWAWAEENPCKKVSKLKEPSRKSSVSQRFRKRKPFDSLPPEQQSLSLFHCRSCDQLWNEAI